MTGRPRAHNYGPYASHAPKPLTSLLKPQKGSSNYCLATFGLSNGCHLPSDFARMYNLKGLYNKGATGAGQTVGIVTLAASGPGARRAYFWSNIAHVNRTGSLTVDNVDGGPGAPSIASGTVETDLDIEQSGALAPGANVIVYQAPNTDPGFADAFFTAASQNIAGGVSASWGESETFIAAAILSGQETATYVAASTRPSSRWPPRDSPPLSPPPTGVPTPPRGHRHYQPVSRRPRGQPVHHRGGRHHAARDHHPLRPGRHGHGHGVGQRIWGWDYLWPGDRRDQRSIARHGRGNRVVGSGGGFSAVEPTPSYQQGVSGTHSLPRGGVPDPDRLHRPSPRAWSSRPPGTSTPPRP